MKQWRIYARRGDFKGIGEAFAIDPVVARILVNRGVVQAGETEAFLHPRREGLHDPHLLKDVSRAAQLLREAIRGGERIRIIGDYDIDGIQSTYILLTALRRCGAQVDYAIPRRVEDGYGVNPSMIVSAKEDGISLILTCDNGIAAAEAVAAAKEAGMTVIVTDHHEVPFDEEGDEPCYRLPPADAVVNPKQADCRYPFLGLCGAAVAWKLVQVLYERMGLDAEEAFVFLENVAFATVGDVMELQGENRTLVVLGLEQLRHTRNPGMEALITRCGIEPQQLGAYHIGFVLGPCLNASGRLDTAAKAMELLETPDAETAAAIAAELLTLNEERKAMTTAGVEEALRLISDRHMEQDKVLVVYLPALHESLAGIVAGRIKEQFHRPVFVITDSTKGAKGSGRSIEGYHMYRELCRCRELFTRFGGHPMAAGISLDPENIAALRTRLNEYMPLSWEEMEPRLMIDVPMPIAYITPELIRQLELLEPFGCGNPKPVFAQKDVELRRTHYIGKEQQYLKFTAEAGGVSVEALYFGDSGCFVSFLEERYAPGTWERLLAGEASGITISIAYYPQINRYRGRQNLQIVITDYC